MKLLKKRQWCMMRYILSKIKLLREKYKSELAKMSKRDRRKFILEKLKSK